MAFSGAAPAMPMHRLFGAPVAIFIALLLIAALVVRWVLGASPLGSLLGIAGGAVWLARTLAAARLQRAADLTLLGGMLVLGSLSALPTDAIGFVSAVAGIAIVLSRGLFVPALRVIWIVVGVVLVPVGALFAPWSPWTVATLLGALIIGMLVGVSRRSTVLEEEEARAELERRHATELAEARAGGLLSAETVRERFPQLTMREAEVLSLVIRGRSNPQIASDLFLAVTTVKSHVNAILSKLHAQDRAHAIALVVGTA